MTERSFNREGDALRLGGGQEFKGEAILAVVKALLQSGVSYVSCCYGAPCCPPHRQASGGQRRS